MGRVTRFQVMAVLQAARAQALGFDIQEAKSWGLNRALFYAAAKRRWADAKAIGFRRPMIPELDVAKQRFEPAYQLGGEKAYLSRDAKRGLRFKFGNEVQLPRDFDHQVKSRFDDWESAWSEAVQIIRDCDKKDLRSQNRFFEKVYKPRRDALAEKWSGLSRLPLKVA